MDRKQLCRLIDDALTSIPDKNIEVFFEGEDNIRVEVVSDYFKGMHLTARIEFLTDKFIDLITMDDLQDFHFIYNPLTNNEKTQKISETVDTDFNEPSGLKKVASDQSIHLR